MRQTQGNPNSQRGLQTITHKKQNAVLARQIRKLLPETPEAMSSLLESRSMPSRTRQDFPL
ncbi:hypothetical protein KTH_47990 [Thermosporothrix hazakensis]|nr:hypothetical protein KTH_47990 [Thermosporothrix hazakensis]